ncbi:hypothetical protein [Kitasatospora sp. NPDC093558]|uniref:hypothetical protein n=1 Tax=Kitasatospora sp. NPDC093558 TaxID=3155201 RepID=UPI00343B04AC
MISDVCPRSVIPGRRHWDVELVLGRPRTAEVLAAALRRVPGITEAQASPVTGGVAGGTHEELLARHGLYASLWQLQAGELAA